MPTFLPKIPATLAISFSVPSLAISYWLGTYAFGPAIVVAFNRVAND